jgi:hypothetical protein
MILPFCKSGAYCEICRNREGGRAWRVAALETINRKDDVDFACWHGKEWQWTSKDKSRGVGDTIAKTTHAIGVKPCRGCKDRQEKLNKMFPYKKDGA